MPYWPASRSARRRSTGRFASGRAFPGRGPSRVCVRSTSNQLPPGFQAIAFAGLAGVVAPSGGRCSRCGSRFLALLRSGGACIDWFGGVPRGRPAWPVTVHALARRRACARDIGQAGIQGFQLRSTFRTVASTRAGRPSTDLRPYSASGTAHLVAEAVKPRAIRCNSPGFLTALQGLTGRPCRGFRPRSLHALAVPHRPLLEPQGIYRSHCGDSDCAEPLSLLGFLPSCPWPRPRWAACLAHGFTANTECVAASPLFALAGPRHLDWREAGLPRSGLSGRW